MKLYQIYKELLNEALSPEMFHATYIRNIIKILEENKVNLSSNLGTQADRLGGKFFFLSFSRTGSPKLAYGHKRVPFSRIVFDGNKLNHNFKSLPVDYWGDKGRTHSSFEYEDRLVTDKPVIDNVSRYILRIDIVTDFGETNVYDIKRLLKLAEQRNVKVSVYGDMNDMVKKTNDITDKILSINNTYNDDKYNYTVKFSGIKNLIAILMYDKKYFDNNGYDEFKKDLEIFLEKTGFEYGDDPYKIFDTMRYLMFNPSDIVQSLQADLHNYFKSGGGGKFRDEVKLLVKEMRSYGVNNIKELINIKVNGIKPKGQKKDYKGQFVLYELGYDDEWNIAKDVSLENSRIYFNTTNYGGYLDKDDMDVFFDYRREDKRLYDFINYLLNKYTFKKTQEIIYNSGYDSYDKTHRFKLEKK